MASIPNRERGGSPLELWRAVSGACAEVNAAIERELEPLGLSPGAYEVLTQLAAAPGGRMRMHDLAAAVHLSRSGLTRLVDRLERAGLASRARCSDDRRGAYACLTAAGRAAARRAAAPYGRVLDDRVGRLSADERRSLRRILQRLRGG